MPDKFPEDPRMAAVYTEDQLQDRIDIIQTAFNNALNFALDESDNSGMPFLHCWREGNWGAIRNEWPEFVEKYGIPV